MLRIIAFTAFIIMFGIAGQFDYDDNLTNSQRQTEVENNQQFQ